MPDDRASEPSADALLPCPFCGGRAVFGEILESASPHDIGGHFITCSGCIATTDLRFANKEDPRPLLAEQWNRREEAAQAVQRERERIVERMGVLFKPSYADALSKQLRVKAP